MVSATGLGSESAMLGGQCASCAQWGRGGRRPRVLGDPQAWWRPGTMGSTLQLVTGFKLNDRPRTLLSPELCCGDFRTCSPTLRDAALQRGPCSPPPLRGPDSTLAPVSSSRRTRPWVTTVVKGFPESSSPSPRPPALGGAGPHGGEDHGVRG